MPVLITVRNEPSGDVSVDFQRTARDRVVLLDFRELARTMSPRDLSGAIHEVYLLPKAIPWRSGILDELKAMLEQCRQSLANGRGNDGPDLTDVGPSDA